VWEEDSLCCENIDVDEAASPCCFSSSSFCQKKTNHATLCNVSCYTTKLMREIAFETLAVCE